MFSNPIRKETSQLQIYIVDEHKEQLGIDFILSDYSNYKITLCPQHLETSFK